MTVTDNGQGFEVPGRAEEMVSAGRLGLMGMYERAWLLDGNLQIKSAPGQGTELTVKAAVAPRHAIKRRGLNPDTGYLVPFPDVP